eukprot:scaffold2191_cov254-Pinguiococcus_pyrenoidosus.AAC.14
MNCAARRGGQFASASRRKRDFLKSFSETHQGPPRGAPLWNAPERVIRYADEKRLDAWRSSSGHLDAVREASAIHSRLGHHRGEPSRCSRVQHATFPTGGGTEAGGNDHAGRDEGVRDLEFASPPGVLNGRVASLGSGVLPMASGMLDARIGPEAGVTLEALAGGQRHKGPPDYSQWWGQSAACCLPPFFYLSVLCMSLFDTATDAELFELRKAGAMASVPIQSEDRMSTAAQSMPYAPHELSEQDRWLLPMAPEYYPEPEPTERADANPQRDSAGRSEAYREVVRRRRQPRLRPKRRGRRKARLRLRPRGRSRSSRRLRGR